MVPDTSPPAMIVQFDPAQTSAQAIGQQAKIGLESDSFVPTTFAVNVVSPQPELLNVAALNPVRFFAETDLFVHEVQPGQLTLDNYLFGCGTCMDAILNQLPGVNGVASVERQAVPGGTALAVVGFDPSVVTKEDVAQAAKGILETDVLLGSTVTVHFDDTN